MCLHSNSSRNCFFKEVWRFGFPQQSSPLWWCLGVGGGGWGRALGGAVVWVSEKLTLNTEKIGRCRIFWARVPEHCQAPVASAGSRSGPSRGWHARFWRPLPEAAFLSMFAFYLLKLLRGQHHPAVCLVILWGENQPSLWATCEALLQESCVPA